MDHNEGDYSALTRFPDEPDEHPEFFDSEGAGGRTWEPAMGKVRGPMFRSAFTKDRFGNVTATPIPDKQQEFVTAALPYLKAEDAGLVLANPNGANSMLFAAQRYGDIPQDVPRISLLQAVLAMRADFDRRIRQHAIPPRDGQLGRERFEDTAVLAAQVPALEAAYDALVDALQQVLADLGSQRDLRELIAEKLEAGQSDRDALLGE